MIQAFLEWIKVIGLPGLFLVMFLEGSSLPFPGVVMVLTYGYLLSPGYLGTAILAVGMGIAYSIASLIPYFIAIKLEQFLPKRIKKGLKKGQSFFNRYGVWSIALSRPFGVGNYISYIAGMSNVNVFKYFILTFIGIYPWSYVMIILGDFFNGNYEAFKQFFQSYSMYIYGTVIILVIVIALFLYKKIKQRKGGNFKIRR
ncbi:DedA family protein [Virgibacillus alimentarius]|uniref:Membrane protein DedA with SNARE-associated domain n=1 Tax=Virgibacillus alimentarius TaxID=698769 RepID=A0ABS4S7T7_9BACI|nr:MULTISPECIES: VTT domain-containing protein [Virgibacillus]MBP2257547.1 membrane protein DedA with SNARE-associated domain [Virgibacillus alimentarius]HLR68897.1 VTT domain-containing protein [Virgibacillus sp.]